MPRLRWFFPLLLTVTLFSLCPTIVGALDYENCVIVMFERDVITLPEGLSQCSFDSASVSLPTIESILESNGASIVAALVPDFELADTLVVSRLGVVCKVTDWSNAFLIEVPATEYVDSLVADLQGVAGIVYAEPAAVPVYGEGLPYAFPSPCTNDPVFAAGDQWQYQNFGLDAGGQLSPGALDADIDMVEAWEITSGHTDTMTVAVLDDGVYRKPADLAGKITGRVLTDVTEEHGTAVAGLIAARANNSIAMSGVNPNAKIYTGEVFKKRTTPPVFYPSRLINSIASIVNAQIPIVNMSFSITSLDPVQEALRNAYNAGTLLVAAQTTDERPPGQSYPARYGAPVLAVGYTDHDDIVPQNQMEGGWLDIVAPGDAVISLFAGEDINGVGLFFRNVVCSAASVRRCQSLAFGSPGP